MKIDAKVKFNDKVAKQIGRDYFTVPIDFDYVEADFDSIYDYVSYELGEKFGGKFFSDEYEIVNYKDLLKVVQDNENALSAKLRQLLRRYFECNDNGNPNSEHDPDYTAQDFVDDVHDLVGNI